MNPKAYLLIGIFSIMLSSKAIYAQQISIDRGIRIESLWCFPLVTDSLEYLYLPDQSQLAVDNDHHPQFSFIRYVNTLVAATDSGEHSISQAQGGGMLHFLVTYETDGAKILRAQGRLREMFNNDQIKLKGPVIFKEGRFALVSSILNPENGKTEKNLLAVGEAPVLEGTRIALSFELDPQRSKLLLESFKMQTPDVSLVFDLTFSGLSESYNAVLTVDWSEIRKYEKISAGASVYFVSADLEKIYEDLQRTSAIKLETAGNDDKTEGLVNLAYSKITDLIFKTVDPGMVPPAERDGLASLMNGLFAGGGNVSGGKLFPFSAHAAYKVKDLKSSGSSVLHFNSRVSSDRHHYITFNIGNFYQKYGNNKNYFHEISLEDIHFERRNIYVGIDGNILPEFDKLINSVTVTLRKQHANGSLTVDELNILKNTINQSKPLSMAYDAVGDTDKLAWLNYEYKAQFQFRGGKGYSTPWLQQNTSMINLYTPYERRTIRLDLDTALLKQKKVKVISVRIAYPFFDEIRNLDTMVKPDDNVIPAPFEITLPLNELKYHYEVKWTFKDGSTKTSTGENDTTILFLDEIPEN